MTQFDGLKLGEWDWDRVWEIDFDVPKSVQRNGSLYADVFLSRDGAGPDPSKAPRGHVVHARKRASASCIESLTHTVLTKYLPGKRIRVERNLLSKSDEPEVEPEPEKPLQIVSYWYSNLTLVIVNEPALGACAECRAGLTRAVPYSALQPPMQQRALACFSPALKHADVQLTDDPVDEKGHRRYLPIVSSNDFWHLSTYYAPINESVTCV